MGEGCEGGLGGFEVGELVGEDGERYMGPHCRECSLIESIVIGGLCESVLSFLSKYAESFPISPLASNSLQNNRYSELAMAARKDLLVHSVELLKILKKSNKSSLTTGAGGPAMVSFINANSGPIYVDETTIRP